jgi:hypothetical protein
MAEKEHDKEHEKRAGQPGPFANATQDPDHPSNKSPARDTRPGAERDHIEGAVYSSKNLMTEQEKDASGRSLGVGPMTESENSPGPVETMEDLDIGPRTPYPTGDPPPPAESATYSQGIKGVTDKPSAKPNSSTGPAGKAPALGDRDAAYRADHKEKR